MTTLATMLERSERTEPDASIDDPDTVLRRLEFEVIGPLADGNRMNLTLCTSTTTSSSSGSKKQR